MSQPLLTPTSRGTPQAPGRAPLRGITGTEDPPPSVLTCVPPARPCEAPARGADERSMTT
jgi:hypothetical protein